ncbi:hypothetical protein CSA17_00570 [bacterium DOLJORAL78_65_58]|nr:MAG: hypothetical protein CSA17_00570 [bacterium DOLJORAL78_65_58]
MKTLQPKVRLARSCNNTVDWNLDTQEITIMLGTQEITLCRCCFEQLTDIAAQAGQELARLEGKQTEGERERERKLRKALEALNISWIKTGCKKASRCS